MLNYLEFFYLLVLIFIQCIGFEANFSSFNLFALKQFENASVLPHDDLFLD